MSPVLLIYLIFFISNLLIALFWFKQLKNKQTKADQDLTAEEKDILLWLSLNFRHGITTIADLVSQSLEKPGLSFQQKEKLNQALKESKKLLKTGRILEEKIDQQTD